MKPRTSLSLVTLLPVILGWIAVLGMSPILEGAEEWELILQQAMTSERSQTRHEGLKQVDTSTAKGLRALWNVLALPDTQRLDWFVREGAYEALLRAEGEEAEKEIEKVLKGSGNELCKEAILYSIVWKIRNEVVKAYGENNDRKIEEVKYYLRKKRGVDYFEFVLPVIKKLDPTQKYLKRLQGALADKHPRVRRAALTGLMTLPDGSSIPLLIDNLKKLEKQKAKLYREWVLTRHALETLTGQYYRESVSDWARWWEIAKDNFSIAKRVEEEKGKEGEGGGKTAVVKGEEKGKEGEGRGKTVVVKREGVEVTVHMKVAGPPDGYPLLVIPWRGYEVDYFRPYFHGIEEFCRVYYVRMPQIEDYKGLPRHADSNLVKYPTQILAKALADLMKDSGLEQFGVLAHGPDAGVLAMMLIADYSDRVTHAVFINPRSSGDVYSNAIENVRREGLRTQNSELVKGADSIMLGQDGNPKYKAADSGESGGMGRALDNLHFADPSEPEVGALGYLYDLPGGTQVLNDSSWSAKSILASKKVEPKVLFFMGEKSPWTPVSDMTAVAGNFKQPTIVKLPTAAETPFISDTYLFTKSMETFFKGAKSPAKKAAEGEKATKKKTKTAPKKKSPEA